MSTQQSDAESLPGDIAERSVATVRRWLAESTSAPSDANAERLAGVLKDPRGLDFTLGFVDRVVRPEDLGVAARNLEQLSRSIPRFLPWYQRAAISFGGGFAPQFPWLVVPAARRVLRSMVGHLVIDATPAQLDASLQKLRREGIRLNLNLLGEAVLGDDEADRRLAGTRLLLERDDVDYVSIKVSSITSQLSMWAFEETVERVVARLLPLYEFAAASQAPKFINLDMEEYRDLDLTIAVFQRLLDTPSLSGLEAGIVLQAYLPDSFPALQGLTVWAMERRARGGAAIKVRLVKGANLTMEHVDAVLHGWPQATWPTKQATDTHYKRLLDWAFTPERTDAVHIGVAGHNLFDVAFAWLLAQHRGVESAVDFEMLLGMASGQAEAVRRDVGSLLLYTPVVHPREFDSAISYLVRRLEENASSENFMSDLFELAGDEVAFAREANRFRASLADLGTPASSTNRVQDRTHQLAALLGDNEDAADEVIVGDAVVDGEPSEDPQAPQSPEASEADAAADENAVENVDENSDENSDESTVDAAGGESPERTAEEQPAVEHPVVDNDDIEHLADDTVAAHLASGGATAIALPAAAADADSDVEADSDVDGDGDADAEVEAPGEVTPEGEMVPLPAASRIVHSFSNAPDTDPAIAANRVWGRRVIERSQHSTIGRAGIAVARVASTDRIDRLVDATARAGEVWGARSVGERARVLHDAGDVIAAFRGRLIEVMAVETGKTIAEGDVEVSEAVDFAHYYAEQALQLDEVAGARFVPARLTVVTPPWNFPVAITAGSVLAALAAGSGVILKPAPQAKRSAAVLMDALWEAGVSRDLLTLVDIEEGELGEHLVSHPSVDRVILTGGWATAELFRSWRADLPLVAETSGKNAIVVTPSADLDLAVADIVRSAFGHAGQKCSAASLVIMVGSVASSARFTRQLVDAVSSLRVGYPTDLSAQMGPLIEPAEGKLLDALTTLGTGEKWLVTPKKLDDSGRLWSPGLRGGVKSGSPFHLTEYFGPVLGLMTADTLDDAIALQNAPEYGLTAGIHSLDRHEVAQWVHTVQAGNLYVNRGITGAIVRRQPFGGWKRSSVGAGAKAGGPNYLVTLGSWEPVEFETSDNLKLEGLSRPVAKVIKRAQEGLSFAEFDRVRRGAKDDERVWASEFGVARDISNLEIERNVLRYRSLPVTLRLAEGESMGDLVRLIAAGARAGSSLWISTAFPLPITLLDLFNDVAAPLDVQSVLVETDARWHERIDTEGLKTSRVRLVGPADAAVALAGAIGGNPDVAVYSGPVTTAGRLELLAFVREQAVSITAHRFGNPDRVMGELPL